MPIRRVPVTVTATAPELTTHEFSFDIEPYLMGGGAELRKHDPVSPVRATSILGQVRWFWRVLNAHLPAQELREREGQLFGSSTRRAAFVIQVVSRRGHRIAEKRLGQPGAYLLFSARGDNKNDPAEVSTGVSGSVRVVFQDNTFSAEVMAAFRAWSLLGGVGARTRRGVGAVQVAGGPGTNAALKTILVDLCSNRAVAQGRRSLRGVWISEQEFQSAEKCFDALDDWYKRYRQDRRPGGARPGRSYWDEPEEIRRLTRRRMSRHQPLTPSGKHASGWARAALGLPIVFQFKDARDGDPDAGSLEGVSVRRMASPLMFRPVRLSPNNYVAVVALLSGPYFPSDGLALKVRKETHVVPPSSEADRVFSDLLPGLGGQPVSPLGLVRVV